MTTPNPASVTTLQTLLAGLVDYAGLFPPAALPMSEAVANYAAYLDSSDAWALGRFVVPATRLEELAAEAARYTGSRNDPWRVSALLGETVPADAKRVRAFNAAYPGRMVVDVVEWRASSPAAVAHAAAFLPADVVSYVELPLQQEPRPIVEALRRAGMRAKARTGGTTVDSIPSSAHLARFIVCCARLGVPFKVTAGLHHPVRGDYPLTYAPGAQSAPMFGFLNVFIAAAFAYTGFDAATLERVLDEREPTAFQFDERRLHWRTREVTREQLEGARSTLAFAFGSCSFREPIDDLCQLGLL